MLQKYKNLKFMIFFINNLEIIYDRLNLLLRQDLNLFFKLS